MWKAEPERINILDVRTPEEYIFVGHPDMARNIPILFVKYQLDADKNEPAVAHNPDFVYYVKSLFAPPPTRSLSCAGLEAVVPWRSTCLQKPGS
jgi:hypothetical protein